MNPLKRLREPSTLAGAALTFLGFGELAEVFTGPEAEAFGPSVTSGEFVQALAIVIAGVLAMLLREKGERDDGQ